MLRQGIVAAESQRRSDPLTTWAKGLTSGASRGPSASPSVATPPVGIASCTLRSPSAMGAASTEIITRAPPTGTVRASPARTQRSPVHTRSPRASSKMVEKAPSPSSSQARTALISWTGRAVPRLTTASSFSACGA